MSKPALNLLPTHSCFDDVQHIWKMILDPLLKKGEDLHETTRVVHGICNPGKREPSSHAWVENRGSVYECKLAEGKDLVIIGMKKRDFYRYQQIKDFTAYTLREFALLNVKHGHSGPFEDRYFHLCRGRRSSASSI